LETIDHLLARVGLSRADLDGTAVQGEVPLSNGVVNRLIADQLSRRSTPVASVQVDGGEADSAAILVVPKARLVPPIRVRIRIEQQPEFPQDPVLRLRWSMPSAGPLALLAGPALALFGTLPPGVRLDGDRLAIDLGELLASRGLGALAGCIRSLRVHTRPGGFLLRFDVKL
jgi:hypothetical protein